MQPITPEEINVADLKNLLPLCGALIVEGDNPSREILKQIDICAFWGARTWVLWTEEHGLVSFNMTRLGKKKISVWEPYANWFLSFTVPAYRRQGHAKALALHIKQLAREAGCKRIKSLAGSWRGALLHASVGDKFWGFTPTKEAIVDSPLNPSDVFPASLPKGVRSAMKGFVPENPNCVEPFGLVELESKCGGPRLRYDL